LGDDFELLYPFYFVDYYLNYISSINLIASTTALSLTTIEVQLG